MGKGLILAATVAALTGCTTARGFCAAAAPMRLSARVVETLSDQEARALLAHNRKGEKLCGWRP